MRLRSAVNRHVVDVVIVVVVVVVVVLVLLCFVATLLISFQVDILNFISDVAAKCSYLFYENSKTTN